MTRLHRSWSAKVVKTKTFAANRLKVKLPIMIGKFTRMTSSTLDKKNLVKLLKKTSELFSLV